MRLIVTSSPGGGTDTTARFITPKLAELLGQPVVIDNRPGASTMIGMEAAARSTPDGYTLVIANSTMAILPTMKKDVRMDVLRGLAPVSLVSSNPQLVVAANGRSIGLLHRRLSPCGRGRPRKGTRGHRC